MFPLSLALLAAAHPVPVRALPQLGDAIPQAILKARAGTRVCATGEGHHDPCATVRIREDRITVAWDAATRKVTFLYSTTLQTDDDLVAGGLGRITVSSSIQPFLGGFVSPDWCDTDAELSGDALWCAVMKPAPRHQGKVLGFVQSIYLLLPDGDGVSLLPTAFRGPTTRRSATSWVPHLRRGFIASKVGQSAT